MKYDEEEDLCTMGIFKRCGLLLHCGKLDNMWLTFALREASQILTYFCTVGSFTALDLLLQCGKLLNM